MYFIGFIIVGLIAGFLAGKIMRGGGFGILVNLILGVVGGVFGGWIFSLLGISTTSIWLSLLSSVVGAILILWIASLFNNRNRVH